MAKRKRVDDDLSDNPLGYPEDGEFKRGTDYGLLWDERYECIQLLVAHKDTTYTRGLTYEQAVTLAKCMVEFLPRYAPRTAREALEVHQALRRALAIVYP